MLPSVRAAYEQVYSRNRDPNVKKQKQIVSNAYVQLVNTLSNVIAIKLSRTRGENTEIPSDSHFHF